MTSVVANERMKVYLNHVKPSSQQTNGNRFDSVTNRAPQSVDVKRVASFLENPLFERGEVQKVFSVFDNEIFAENTNLYDKDLHEARERAVAQTRYAMENLSTIQDDPTRVVMKIGLFSVINLSVGTKIAAQSALFGGSLVNLGTKRHSHLVPLADQFKLVGSFAMTELAHGSNVKALQTTATYDPKTKEFVVNTPNKGAIKWWIGNALYATVATVFARLVVGGKDYGVHAILVPLRDEQTRKELPGVIIGDCGEKNGLRGVDNGFIIFENVRVPRENLLNRFSDVDENGVFHSKFSGPKLFASLLGELTTGRSTIVVATLNVRKLASTIATRYAFQRCQFGPDGKPETPIINYSSHAVRLMPIIASCYACELAFQDMLQKFGDSKKNNDPKVLAELHALSAGLKAVFTWDTREYLSVLRECCGGHGYSAYNRIGQLAYDSDITLTYEGDNTVLIQQVSAYLMKQYALQFKGTATENVVKFLQDKMGTYIKKRNPIITRLTSKTHLMDSEFHLQAFEYRTANLLQECISIYNDRRKKKKLDDFYSWEASVPTMVKLVRAFVEQYCLEQFVKRIESLEEKSGAVYNTMKLVCNVYALYIIDKNIGDFSHVIKASKAHAISRLFEGLCVEMRNFSLSLVDAFELPDYIIGAPIGLAKSEYIDSTLNCVLKRASFNSSIDVEKITSLPK